MTEDLLKKIRADYNEFAKRNKYIQQCIEKIESGSATFKEVDSVTKATGYALKVAFEKNIADNISEFANEDTIRKILNSTLGDNYEFINLIATNVQKRLDEKAGISIVPQKAPFPSERTNNLAAYTAKQDLSKDSALRDFSAATENIVNSIYTDYVKENAEFRSNAGLEVTVSRWDDVGCCYWCESLVGKYTYPDVPDDIWRRHKNCSCVIDYTNSKTGSRERIKFSDTRNGNKMITTKQVTQLTPEQAAELERKISERKPLTKFTFDQAKQREKELKEKIANRVDKSEKSGIIELYRKGKTHRKLSESGTQIIDRATYHKIVNPAIKSGADIRTATDEWLKHLKDVNATAVTIGEVIYFRPDATVSDVLEEVYHFYQNKKGLNDRYNSVQRTILNEIDAKEYLLTLTEKYHIPDEEVELTKSQLHWYREQMEEMKNRGEWDD